jgi:hypothetical protein
MNSEMSKGYADSMNRAKSNTCIKIIHQAKVIRRVSSTVSMPTGSDQQVRRIQVYSVMVDRISMT